MLSLKSGLFLGTLGAIAIAVGCSNGPVDEGMPSFDKDPTVPTGDAGANEAGPSKKLTVKEAGAGTASSSSSSSSGSGDDDDSIGDDDDSTGTSSSSSSSGGTPVDAGVDSGPAAPEVGDRCTVQDTLFTRSCGHCGKQQAICTTNRTGALEVSEYGPCGGEPAAAVCAAGETAACGKCGVKTCGSTCGWGSCKNEGVCKPGTITHETTGCPTAGTYRERSCEDTCSFGNLSQCKAPEVIVPAPGKTVSGQWEITSAIKAMRPASGTGACKKTANLNPVYAMPVPLKNTGSTDAIVQIWHSSFNGTGFDSVVTTYANQPQTDADYKACMTEPQDNCTQLGDICNADGGGGWGGVDNVKVPANSTIWIYSTGWSTSNVGKFVLNVKTK